MELSKKQRRQLIVNMVLMVLALAALVACVVAWFSARRQADVNTLTMTVERVHLELKSEITLIEFPCATKIIDKETTPQMFDVECAVPKVYTISEAGKLAVSVDYSSSSAGMLGYVCDSVNTTNYYEEIKADLKQYGNLDLDSQQPTFQQLRTAIAKVNARDRFGETNDNGDTDIKIVYWVEYDEIDDKLNLDSYWDSGIVGGEDETYKAIITFTSAN